MRKLKFLMLVFAVTTIFTACSKVDVDDLVGTYTGTISCTVTIAGEDFPANNIPYILNITSNNDNQVSLDDDFLLDNLTANATSEGYSASDSKTFASIPLGDTTLTNVVFTLNTEGTIDGNILDHEITATGSSDQGTISITCSGQLSK